MHALVEIRLIHRFSMMRADNGDNVIPHTELIQNRSADQRMMIPRICQLSKRQRSYHLFYLRKAFENLQQKGIRRFPDVVQHGNKKTQACTARFCSAR